MRRDRPHPALQAAATARYLPMLSDPLNPLAEQVGKVVAARMQDMAASAPKGGKKAEPPMAPQTALQAEMALLIADELERMLSMQTEEGSAIRMALIAKLAASELGGAVAMPSISEAADTMLTTAEAAVRLDVSRPYVSMLCDQGKLGEVVLTEGGHRRIRSSAVEAYRTARTQLHERMPSPREAAAEAALYDVPEGHFKNVARKTSARPPGKSSGVKAGRRSGK